MAMEATLHRTTDTTEQETSLRGTNRVFLYFSLLEADLGAALTCCVPHAGESRSTPAPAPDHMSRSYQGYEDSAQAYGSFSEVPMTGEDGRVRYVTQCMV